MECLKAEGISGAGGGREEIVFTEIDEAIAGERRKEKEARLLLLRIGGPQQLCLRTNSLPRALVMLT